LRRWFFGFSPCGKSRATARPCFRRAYYFSHPPPPVRARHLVAPAFCFFFPLPSTQRTAVAMALAPTASRKHIRRVVFVPPFFQRRPLPPLSSSGRGWSDRLHRGFSFPNGAFHPLAFLPKSSDTFPFFLLSSFPASFVLKFCFFPPPVASWHTREYRPGNFTHSFYWPPVFIFLSPISSAVPFIEMFDFCAVQSN